MYQRKNFSYRTASVDDILAHFLTSSRQAICVARKFWKDDDTVSSRIEEAYLLYKIQSLKERLTSAG